MKISTMARHVREGLKNVLRNSWMSFASISSIAISLFILGGFLLLTLNINELADDVERKIEVRVYLDVGVSLADRDRIWNDIGSIPEVSEVVFVSKEEGLEIVKENFGEQNAAILEGYEGDNNPLPDSFTVKVDEPTNVAFVADMIKGLYPERNPQPILDVQYGEGTVETLFRITNAVRIIGIVLVFALAFTAMFLISNTIKITIIARRREISIMKLVGATNGFIRWPFFIEGAVLGLIGSIIPTVVLLWGYATFVNQTQLELGFLFIRLLTIDEVGKMLAMLLIGIGTFIGVWGSVISVRKFLKV